MARFEPKREFNPKIVSRFELLWILYTFLMGFLQINSQIDIFLALFAHYVKLAYCGKLLAYLEKNGTFLA